MPLRRQGFAALSTTPRKQATTKLGVTPYYKDNDPGYPRRTYASAKALFDEPDWQQTFKDFEAEAHKYAEANGVKIARMRRNVGVFEGEYEPSYSIRVQGSPENVREMNTDLGTRFGQDAVVSFKRDPHGADAEAFITGIKDPDAFYAKLKDVLGNEAGASFGARGVRVFIYGNDPEQARAIRRAAKEAGGKMRLYRGSGDYIDTGAQRDAMLNMDAQVQ